MARIGLRMMPPFPSSPGRAVARTGLRMMPTFPPLSLKFRKAGFPRYGFKAGMSDGPSCRPRVLRVVQFASALRAPRCLQRRILVLSRGTRCAGAPPCKRHWPLYPRGPRSGPSYSVSVHHHLIGPIRPTRQHIAISPECGLYAMPSLCPKGLGDQRVVPGFRCLLLLCMSSSRIPGDPSTVPAQLHRRRLRPSP
jgi:hypothetical protein